MINVAAWSRPQSAPAAGCVCSWRRRTPAPPARSPSVAACRSRPSPPELMRS
jgi:hypothetical protein